MRVQLRIPTLWPVHVILPTQSLALLQAQSAVVTTSCGGQNGTGPLLRPLAVPQVCYSLLKSSITHLLSFDSSDSYHSSATIILFPPWHHCHQDDIIKMEKVQFSALRFVYNDFNESYSGLRSKASRPLMYVQRLRSQFYWNGSDADLMQKVS